MNTMVNIDEKGRSYATGKRKNAIARVYLRKGKGEIIVNNIPFEKYFSRDVLKMIVNQVFKVSKTDNMFDVVATIKGGGLSGQAGALKHGISLALVRFNEDFRFFLKKAGFLTRDSRIVERKKPGRAKARKRYQFSKR